jgi:hypothetical protein
MDEEKKRIKEAGKENKRIYSKINEKIVKVKKDNDIKTVRFKELTKAPAFIPEMPTLPVVKIKGKNLSKELMNDLIAKKEVKM